MLSRVHRCMRRATCTGMSLRKWYELLAFAQPSVMWRLSSNTESAFTIRVSGGDELTVLHHWEC